MKVSPFGTPLKSSAIKVLLLGSGELGKEFTIELQRLGIEVVACDRYENAPAMQVAHRSYVFDMLSGAKLREIVEHERPHFIVPEIEAIATTELIKLEKEGYRVVPNAQATKLTMDREGIRRFAAEELGIATARYEFADNLAELLEAAEIIGFPCVIKPIMSSSGKGQSIVRSSIDLEKAWDVSQSSGRTGSGRVIIEEFIDFESEITLLTVRSSSGTLFCDPIGHRQVDGDYLESWQPHPMSSEQLAIAQDIAEKITEHLGGYGLFGVELFLTRSGRVIFSEVSPRPHDTGMVTLATQTFSEFALHARAILGLPITDVSRYTEGASAAFRAPVDLKEPVYDGVEEALGKPGIDLRIFGKPQANTKRRMAVILARNPDWKIALDQAKAARACITIREAHD